MRREGVDKERESWGWSRRKRERVRVFTVIGWIGKGRGGFLLKAKVGQ